MGLKPRDHAAAKSSGLDEAVTIKLRYGIGNNIDDFEEIAEGEQVEDPVYIEDVRNMEKSWDHNAGKYN
jgi:hypothetical protein